MAGLLGVYIIFRSWLQSGSPSATWQGWSTDALRGWGAYLKIALPSVVMLCGKWWTYEAGEARGSLGAGLAKAGS